ncbi:MAG: Flp family type IVb pilin [Anaerolineae bacterium]
MWSRMEAWLRLLQSSLNSPPIEKGQGLVEYAMILILAVVMMIVLLAFFGPWLNNVYLNIIGVL